MAIYIKPNGEAVVQESAAPAESTGTSAAGGGAQAADAAGSEKITQGSGANTGTNSSGSGGIPEAAAAGVSAGQGVDFSGLSAEYAGRYDAQLADLYNQITQRKPFSYSSEDDQMYQQYVDRYTAGGQLAMMDTLGQAAGLTGGYGSSYGQRVGQQAYDEYMLGLNDKMLELEERAYGRWQDEGDRLMQNYGLLGDLDDRDYGRFKDQYNMTADQYDRYMQEAALRADFGDFGGLAGLYGGESAGRMQQLWAAQNLMPLYQSGQMDAETYKDIAGVYPAGYIPGGGAGGGSGAWDGGVWGPGGGKKWTTSDVLGALIDGYSREQIESAIAAGNNTQAERADLSYILDRDEYWDIYDAAARGTK